MFWFLGLSAGTLPLLVALHRRQELALHRGWSYPLTDQSEEIYRALAQRVEGEIDLAWLAYAEAFALRERGTHSEAARVLEAAFKVVERSAPNLIRLLASMATFSRRAAVVAPMPPLRPTAFRLLPLAFLACLAWLLDHVLVSTAERFRLRMYVLGHAYGLAVRALLRESERMLRRSAWSRSDRRRLESIHGDLVTLAEELLGSLRALLASLAAVPRAAG